MNLPKTIVDMCMNWKDYQEEVHKNLLRAYPGAEVSYDVKLAGRYSKSNRQIDVLIESSDQRIKSRVIVDAKYFARKIDVKCVESFISMVDDVGGERGLLISQKGYSKAAINRAYYDPRGIDLDVLDLAQLSRVQALEALPYSGNRAIMITSPFGWVIDAERREGVLAVLYQRGLTLSEAERRHEWMYVNFWHKDSFASNIDELIELQNNNILDEDPSAAISLVDSVTRDDGRQVRVRNVTWAQRPFREITGYIDCDDYVVFLVLITPPIRETRNTEKLLQVLKHSKPAEIEFDNTVVIKQLEDRLTSITDPIEIANAYCQLADWLSQMGRKTAALVYRRRCWDAYPETYRNISPLISSELEALNFDNAKEYAVKFFSMAPTNPRVMQDLMQIYSDDRHIDYFKDLVAELKLTYSSNSEALGNLNFHLGVFLANNMENELAAREFEAARLVFLGISKDHYVIAELDKMLSRL